jgi:hypothetical protein
MLTEHLCIIISETEKQKAQKLANLYRQLEFEEAELKEARKDLVAAIAEEARRTSDSSALYAKAATNARVNSATTMPPNATQVSSSSSLPHPSVQQPPHPNATFVIPPKPLPHDANSNRFDAAMTANMVANVESADDSAEERSIFSGFSWGDVTNTVGGVVTDTVNSLILANQGPQDRKEERSGNSVQRHTPPVSTMTAEDEDIADIPMEELFKGFSPEELNDLMK